MMKRARRLALWIAVPLALLLLAGKAFDIARSRKFYPTPPVANVPPALDTATAQRQDFDYFRNYFELNRSYTPEARERAARLLADDRAPSGSLSPAQFDLAITRMVALADNGHSRVHPMELSRRHNRLPCRLYHFSDGYYVIRARPVCSRLLGAKVIAVDGRPVDEAAGRMFEYVGGPRSHYDQFASVFFLESPDLLQAAGLAAAADRLNLRVVLRGGTEENTTVIAEPADGKAPWIYSNSYLALQPIDNESADWASLLPADSKLPLFLSDFANPFQSDYWADMRVYFVQFRSNEDEPGHPIRDFIARVKHAIAADRPRVIVLDLRFDQGGDLTTTASFMKQLAGLADSVEHVYVLTSGWTFSAGDASLALVKDHGGEKVTVIGEPVGDRIRLWAEGGRMTLPNSKLNIGFATGLHDYSHSCWREPGCFWVMYFYPMHVASLEPDIRVRYSFDDYINLRDPFLERALALAHITPAGRQ